MENDEQGALSPQNMLAEIDEPAMEHDQDQDQDQDIADQEHDSADQDQDAVERREDAAVDEQQQEVMELAPSITQPLSAIVRPHPGRRFWLQGSLREQQVAADDDEDDDDTDRVVAVREGHSNKQTSGAMPRVNIGQAALMITVATLLARVLGLLRGSLFTGVLGATTTSDAFNRAFLIPNSIYTIVTGGALISAFIPVFHQYMLEKHDRQEAWRVASLAINLATLAMVALGLLAMVFARPLVTVYNPGISAAQLDLVASLTRIMLLQAIVMGVGIVISAILNARQHFFLPALGSVLYSAGLIIGLLPGLVLAQLHQRNDLIAVYCATGGVVLGAVLMVGVQFFGLPKVGMHYTFSLQWRHPGVVQMVRLMIPRVINAVALNLSLTMDVFLVSLLAFAGFVTLYTLAFTILMIPLGMVINVATAMFPAMTEYAASGRMDRFRAIVLNALRSTLFLAIPAAIGLILLSLPIVQVLYEHGPFTLNDAVMTSIPLMGYAVGLPGWAVGEILTRSFYALRDSKTPVIVSIWQFALKIALSLVLMDPIVWLAQMRLNVFVANPSADSIKMASAWGMGALAFATSLAVLSEAGMLLWLLHKRIGGLYLRSLIPFISRIMAAVVVMILTIAVTRWLLDLLIVTGGTYGTQSLRIGEIAKMLLKLGITVAVGALAYLRIARYAGLLASEELAPIQRLLARLHLSRL